MTKLADVAKKAGVSPTTVSRVINNYGAISQKTRSKVHEAMKELNYQPNSLARSLQGKKTQLIGLIFPSITNPFYAELIATIENQLFKNHYKVILCNAADDPQKERDYLNMLVSNQVDGIIVGTHAKGLKEYGEVKQAIVSFDRYLADSIPIIGSDNYQGAALAATELIASSAKNIYFLGNVHAGRDLQPTDQREIAFRKILSDHNLEPHFLPLTTDLSVNIKHMMIRDLLANNQKIDGIMTTDDLTALLTINVAQELSINVPQKLRVVGFDGTKFIQDFYPDLTTIAQPIPDIAELLITTLFKQIDEKVSYQNKHFILPNKLIKGGTTHSN
ncbi:LacI family DNA-binding transcriptional regulator [Xylocopilactobacillus apicola]|uniref:LacI family transcriptional regulator n=1 Tax=Xylocopilactobacillus apicola TaxID=2932184 RepID=A0AAU9D284_9LACO|nr:LacI family DNA-binding transcriptional regulator [Xylocopilactobacillus apicola]BDR58881.1 LacI family transcriptional regulator [Xylocopilactobacillus apicola]